MLNDFEELEEMKEWIEELKSENILVIVEGESDKKSLEDLGIADVKALARKQIHKLFEEVSAKEIVLLMDMDKKGKELTHKIRQFCQRNKIRCNLKYWKLLPKLKISQVEGIYRRFKRLEAGVA